MPGQAIKLQRLDMGHRRSLGQAGHLRNCCANTMVAITNRSNGRRRQTK
jgi:hypothetical protein